MSYAIGILDQSPVIGNETNEEALQYSIELAQTAELLGHKRFWVAEHHNMEQVAGVSPEILIAHLLAKTKTIHIGSGGVMLQHNRSDEDTSELQSRGHLVCRLL